MSNSALITEIQRFSIHDGPGIRTTVFLKGCPLKCAWCHNPEAISYSQEILKYPEKCIGCGRCDDGCYSGARVVCGKPMSTDEVLSEILRDKPYYGEDGGLTLSGGEPLSHRDFSLELLQKCRKNGIHTAIETSGYAQETVFQEMLKRLDFVYMDVKFFDNHLHKLYTGVDNTLIKNNFRILQKSGKPYIIRTPLIKGITDNEENLKQIKQFIGNSPWEQLPENALAKSKIVLG